MASTGISALDDSRFAAIVQSEIIHELRPAMTTRAFLRQATGGAGNIAQFVLYGDPGPAAAPANDITDIASTAMSDSNIQVTAAEVGQRIDVSDVVRAVSVQNVVADASAMISRSVIEKWETDLAALMDDFSNVTAASSTLTPLDHLAAVAALEQRDIPGPYVAYYHPKQTGELRTEIATTSASYEVGGPDADLVKPFPNQGFFGTYMGVPIWQTSCVVTTAGRLGGAVFEANSSAGTALGYYELWGPRLESQRFVYSRALVIVGTQCYGVVEVSDTRGQTVTSAA